MAKNRKTQSASVRFGPVVKTFLLCLLIGGAGVGYVSQKHRIDLLSEQMKKLEKRREGLQRDRQALWRKLAALQAASALEAQVKKMNLDLAPVPPDRIVHLSVSAVAPIKQSEEQLYAEQIVRVPVHR